MTQPNGRHISALEVINPPPSTEPRPTLDVGDRDSVEALRREAKGAAETKNKVIHHLLSTEESRKWFFDLLDMTGFLKQPFRIGQPDLSAFNCGELNIGLFIFAEVQKAPALYVQMIQENNANV